MLKKEFLKTKDGSLTLYIPEWNEHYHSKHGALQEAEHVFIAHGLDKIKSKKNIQILEIGFGTGLNALLSTYYSLHNDLKINYIAVEKYPIEKEVVSQLNYESLYQENSNRLFFKELHSVSWSQKHDIHSNFTITKLKEDFFDFKVSLNSIDIIYFDAFGIRVQPELWTEQMFARLYSFLKKDGLLTTYACNGKAKRALQAVGFIVEKKPGPPGKREMMNAWKK